MPALAAGGERVAFADYTGDFRVEAQPENPRLRCFDLRRLTSWNTPAPEFFAFHQNRTMQVDGLAWRLRVSGFIERPRTFTLDELRARPDVRTTTAVIECSGNSGNPALMNGLVSNAQWTGVPVATLLDECDLRPEAREIVFFGADVTSEPKWAASGRELAAPHGRSLFVQDAMESGALLAFAMNGNPLSAEHGFPLRLVIPRWYGMAQVKWLTRIHVLDRRYEGRHMARNYHSLQRLEENEWLDTSITRNRLKSLVARVASGQGSLRISGAAWGGPSPIRAVQTRIDNGSWRAAEIDRQIEPHAWRLWTIDWADPSPGLHDIVSRAISSSGEVQPTHEEWRKRFASNREDHSQWVRRIVVSK